jgi:acylphosphatase
MSLTLEAYKVLTISYKIFNKPSLLLKKIMKKSVRLYVSGTVQGVFFRIFVKENAEKLNVKGFVRNLEDGRVEVFLEGDSDDVNKMIQLCQQGPKHSQIKKVDMKPERFQDFKTFKILHI